MRSRGGGRSSGPGGHAWGVLHCPRRGRDGHRKSVWSTPRNPFAHAKDLRRAVNACDHDREGMVLTPTTVKAYRFTVTLAGLPAPGPGLDDAAWDDRMAWLLDDLTGRVLSAGLEDVGLTGVGSRGDVFSLSFDREAESLGKAIGLAVTEVERAGIAVARVEVDDEGP